MPDVEEPRAPATVPATINVEIVSPSAGVPVPLSLPDLPIKTTVAQLKDMVRQKLTVPDPAAVDLRVIYQGRMLAPPELTLENALGLDAVGVSGSFCAMALSNKHALESRSANPANASSTLSPTPRLESPPFPLSPPSRVSPHHPRTRPHSSRPLAVVTWPHITRS
ncbi:hypothetical protein MAPG_09919 [Magnaporthiopsis poae ATCC 64411]|uniref:DSC E3 ubiquitin ligase complex subunit 3 ubiquitin-like domain-containing protein n=1 Tax=Magnaporthiopsis poae (strain ATCC 64411 / 73-15) TaxID=644358 RepID=A0A0C4EB73_MAGP6|nr:hypothetical protein MAPG_09919 [Magnaporthiopsis poae ATCC 64411]